MTSYDETCEFCSVACGKDAAAEIIAQGNDWVAFFPLNPATSGHTLIIPREHAADLWSISPQRGATLIAAVIQLGHAIQRALSPDGMNLISSAGSAAEQTVFHLHLHVVPRWRHDGFGQIWPTSMRFESPELDNVGDRIREELARNG
jgi:histidine triad (HIT) family protein